MPDLGPAVTTVIRRCLAVKEGEDVLVIVDDATRAIGEALRTEARAVGADAVLALMDERATDGTDPARPIAAALMGCDVYIAPTTRSISHTPARKRATDAGIRGATMPGVTEDMLARVMAVDFDLMAARSDAVAALLDANDTAHVTSPDGTDLTLAFGGRPGISDNGNLTAPAAFGNLPCGEAFIAPVGGEGQIVVRSLGSIGISEEPVTLTLAGGRLVDAEGGVGPQFIERLREHGELGCNLAELGIGTNEMARITGLVLEDEKILGTVHVAFGASAGIGGTVSVPIHLDVVTTDVTLTIGSTTVLENGAYVLVSARLRRPAPAEMRSPDTG